MTPALEALIRIADGDVEDDPVPLIEELARDPGLVPRVRAELERFTGQGRTYGRDLMAQLYAELAGTEAFPVVLRLLAADREQEPDWLESTLGKLIRRDRAGCHAVARPLASDPDPALRRAAVWALGPAYEPADFDLLCRAAGDPDPAIRRTAIASLPTYGQEPRVYEPLVAAFDDPDVWVRNFAVRQLAWSAPLDVIDHLIRLAGDPEGPVRSAIGEALGRLAAGSGRAPAAAGVLRRLLNDPQASVRRRAARGIAHLGAPLGAPLDALRPPA